MVGAGVKISMKNSVGANNNHNSVQELCEGVPIKWQCKGAMKSAMVKGGDKGSVKDCVQLERGSRVIEQSCGGAAR